MLHSLRSAVHQPVSFFSRGTREKERERGGDRLEKKIRGAQEV